ncbi:cytochrome c biogenesis CcdA family protein [Methanococcoides sp. AM1]|uniref:cytochrome c biogenesis CcdA family protein n=1 Tax=Methanococcoides sp. AM1 TaxID=1201011 RepID=UPI001082B902|nr:cytochrome c biogenesis protein CcdA [Methanococcoides sp. AM1]
MAFLAFLADLFLSFTLGLLTPLTAVCVLPLYPAFLAYLSNQLSGEEKNKRLPLIFGLVISAGVILFMSLLGLIFTTLLQVSLTNVIGIISPIAFGILFIISLLLIMDYDIGKFLPRTNIAGDRNPLITAFLYGFFFGAIVVPCNPAFIAALFAKSLTSMGFFENFLNFVAFGIGISFPLLVFSAISTAKSKSIIRFLIKYKRKINLSAGIIMLVISVYYLIFVFRVVERLM